MSSGLPDLSTFRKAKGVCYNDAVKARSPTRPSPAWNGLQDLTRLIQVAEGFPSVVSALQAGRSATVDGTWGSSGALVCAGLADPARTILVVIGHPHDVDEWADDLTSFSGAAPEVFPAWDHWPLAQRAAVGEEGFEDRESMDEISGQRLRLLKQLSHGPVPQLLLTTIAALLQPVPDRKQLAGQRRQIAVNTGLDLDELARWLVEHGFERADAVHLPGEFSRRGGILDIFSPDADNPFRIELFGDEVESLRTFAHDSQRSLENLTTIEILGASKPTGGHPWASGHLTDYLSDPWIVLVEPDELREQAKHFAERVSNQVGLFTFEGTVQQLLRFPSVHLSALPSASVETACHLRIESVERFSGDLAKLRGELAGVAGGNRVIIACHNQAEADRLREILVTDADQGFELRCLVGDVRAGFRLVDAGVLLLSDAELFQRGEVRHIAPRRRVESRAIDTFLDLADGDLVVHVAHGIARYRGLKMMDRNGHAEENLALEFRDGLLLYVPASRIDLVQKYVGGTRTDPELAKLGGTRWQRTKEKVESATLDLALEMVDMQAMRESQPGVACPPDSDWQREFEAAFPYQETPDQLTTLVEMKRDMERPRPMDRLICGDVGYGKTELSIRAAFKTIDSGRQVAVLVPTTVLAEQHFRTFSQRLAKYPFVVEGISRFRSAGEQRRIIKRLGEGGVDIIIGTHRLVSPDVKFKDLGLVIIDEEQRFGVDHKERLKRLRQTVDVLTMTATPIPRTLHLALLGIRDISNLETPPPDRLAIETRIARWDATLIRHAITRELNREGQVYFVHNRVHNIKEITAKLNTIVPEAKIAIAHGQMAEGELEQAMVQFVKREADILVATTIIESGLDIPNANTMFINEADQYGLADLHQLRGRVGRYKHRAYAYLLLNADRGVTPIAAKRLKAIEEFTELGAGFKIALRDLEIRGAGNILGTQQSGHIAAVGYEMYCSLLENAVRRVKNQPLRTPLEVTVDLPWPAYLPRDYVEGNKPRIEVYRRLARVRKLEALDDFRQEMRDRFGKIPEAAEWMLRLAELRLLASRWQVAQVRLEGQGFADVPTPASGRKPPAGQPAVAPVPAPRAANAPRAPAPQTETHRIIDVVLEYRNAKRIKALAERAGGRLRVVDDKSAYFRLKRPEFEPEALYAVLKDLLRLAERPL